MNPIKTLYHKLLLRQLLSSGHNPKLEALRGKKKCIICLAADYGNLGDVAITYAQTKFLRHRLPEYQIVDFPISDTVSYLKALQRVCTSDDIITIVGGGNMGDMYYDIELLRLMIVRSFPYNRIISFPQTIDYSDSLNVGYLKKLSRRIYERHNNLLLCAREKISYERMQALYPKCRIKLVPDIVMSLDENYEPTERKGIIFCMRNDREKAETSSIAKEIQEFCILHNIPTTNYDTHIGDVRLSVEQRRAELERIWAHFRKSQWIVTDRLHGMIFAYITQTPAIVLSNSNFKIHECYKWLKNTGYIHFIKNLNDGIKLLSGAAPATDSFSKSHAELMCKLETIMQ